MYDLKNYPNLYTVGDVAYKRNQCTKGGQSEQAEKRMQMNYIYIYK